MARQDNDQTQEMHSVPCNYAKAMMWLLAMLITLAGFALGNMNGRINDLERSDRDSRAVLVEMQTDMKYLRMDVAEIKAALRRGESYRAAGSPQP